MWYFDPIRFVIMAFSCSFSFYFEDHPNWFEISRIKLQSSVLTISLHIAEFPTSILKQSVEPVFKKLSHHKHTVLLYSKTSCSVCCSQKTFASVSLRYSRQANLSRVAFVETLSPRECHFNVERILFESDIWLVQRTLLCDTFDGLGFEQYYSHPTTHWRSCSIFNLSGIIHRGPKYNICINGISCTSLLILEIKMPSKSWYSLSPDLPVYSFSSILHNPIFNLTYYISSINNLTY